jgi:outer membrane protein OmpA-like peptidoglycan-associated protein
MTFKGYGVSKPVHPIPEKNAQEEDDNRRVEILIVEN